MNLDRHLPPKIKIDEMRISQILINLLSNSFKFTQQGRITVNINWFRNATLNENIELELEDPYQEDTERSIIAFEEELKHGRLGRSPNQYDSLTFDRRKYNKLTPGPTPNFCPNGTLKISVIDGGPGMS
eukprot:CAMPEP_0114579636 /NCGR_PEP_ID=MMETSP0125-20121206/3973_1 /TAXON_ID=485358 ORGANISM="Aristerostoma sp., Strain ATCC 50986" /NCGR_SAMPLE_ID=MMETSP0125 /ASSEMBLY_ACC=CAM_ASM_000245 /LENGTH=128 /DNA_ID=CAMNT_0001770499 /DNA_START=233 /DNA_END=619 /DNA_ORIENTATION=-